MVSRVWSILIELIVSFVIEFWKSCECVYFDFIMIILLIIKLLCWIAKFFSGCLPLLCAWRSWLNYIWLCWLFLFVASLSIYSSSSNWLLLSLLVIIFGCFSLYWFFPFLLVLQFDFFSFSLLLILQFGCFSFSLLFYLYLIIYSFYNSYLYKLCYTYYWNPNLFFIFYFDISIINIYNCF